MHWHRDEQSASTSQETSDESDEHSPATFQEDKLPIHELKVKEGGSNPEDSKFAVVVCFKPGPRERITGHMQFLCNASTLISKIVGCIQIRTGDLLLNVLYY